MSRISDEERQELPRNSLHLMVERSLSHEREEGGRPELQERCRGEHDRGQTAIRRQLHRLGIGFDPQGWVDTLSASAKFALAELARGSSPICPYTFEKLVLWSAERSPLDEREWLPAPWVDSLAALEPERSEKLPTDPTASIALATARFDEGEEFERLSGLRLEAARMGTRSLLARQTVRQGEG